MGLQVEARGQGLEARRLQREAAQLALEHEAAGREVLREVDALEPRAHLFARAVGGEEPVLHRQPVALGLDRLAGEHFDAVAGRGPERERHDASVDLCAAAAVADVGVDRIVEVEHG